MRRFLLVFLAAWTLVYLGVRIGSTPRPIPGQSILDCRTWFVTETAALVCDPQRISEAVSQGQLGRIGGGDGPRLVRGTRKERGAGGLTQLKGPPLGPGERLGIEGPLHARARLLFRLADDHRVLIVGFSGLELPRGERAELRVGRGMHAELRGPLPGRQLAPRDSETVVSFDGPQGFRRALRSCLAQGPCVRRLLADSAEWPKPTAKR
jgi:hypothetical protein